MTTQDLASPVGMKQLLEAGAHFGHQTSRWDPRMREYIFTERNGIHIIDLQKTVMMLITAMDFVRGVVASGGTVLFVGTKKQAQETVETEALRCGSPYVIQRWLGGTLTNFRTLRARLEHLARLEGMRDRGEFQRLKKKEILRGMEQIEKLNRQMGGVKKMTQLPQAVYVVDPSRERIAVFEARRLGVPLVALVDTNCNPNEIDYPVPSNDDAIRSVKLLTSKIADAVLEGQAQRDGEAEGPALAETTAEMEARFYEAGPGAETS